MKFELGQRVVIRAPVHPVLGKVAYHHLNGREATITERRAGPPVRMWEIGVNESGNRYALKLDNGSTLYYADEEHLIPSHRL